MKIFTPRTLRTTLSTAAMLATLGTAALADPYPVTFTDERGVTVTLEQAPTKVASLLAAAADMTAALGRKVAATTTYDGAFPVYLGDAIEGTTDLGDLTAPNLELMAAEGYDLIIGMTRYNAPYSEELEKIGAFVTMTSNTLEDSYRNVANLGLLLGAADEAAAMNAEFEALLAEYAAKAPEEKPSVIFMWSFHDTLYGYTSNIMPADLIDRIGAVNPLGRVEGKLDEASAFSILEAEDLLAHDPDVVMVFSQYAGAPLKWNPAYERLSAYKNERFYSVGYQYSQSDGPIARELVLREMAHLLYPDHYEAPEMPDAARAQKATFVE